MRASAPGCLAAALLLLHAAAVAQGPGAIVVAVGIATPAPTAAVLFEIDPLSGVPVALPGFASDSAPPLALQFDPVDDDLLVALDLGASSRVVALRRAGAGFVEQVLGDVPGRCGDLLVDRFGDVLAAVTGTAGGVYRLPRHGGPATLVRAQPFVAAMTATQQPAWTATLGIAAAPSSPAGPGIGELTLDSGQYQLGPVFFPGYQPGSVTGALALPSPQLQAMLSHGDGSFSLHTYGSGQPPLPLASTPPLPAGGAVALRPSPQGPAYVLGGPALPALWRFDPAVAATGVLPLTQVTAALPGAPVDVAVRGDLQASALSFGRGCGTASELRIGAAAGGGLPQPGNAAFAVAMLQGQPGAAALLALGFDELPAAGLPNGCLLGLAPAATALHVADLQGEAAQPLPVPAQPALAGVTLFGQWFQDDAGLPFVTSPILAIRIGP